MWLYAFTPVVAAILGACYAVWKPPGPKVTSAIQHFAAGLVFSAAAGEILPDIMRAHSALPIVIGGGLGILAMVAVSGLESRAKGRIGFIVTNAIDVLIDGLVLGIAFAAGTRQGFILGVALTAEILFLGLSMVTSLSRMSRLKVIGITAAVALMMPVGALTGTAVGGLPPHVMAGFFSFGLIALLYLVTEELLVEAHELPDTPWTTAMFFVGFLSLMLLEEFSAA